MVVEFYDLKHNNPEFIPGISSIPVNGRVFDENELLSLIDASLEFWLTDGDYSEKFSEKLSDFIGMKHVRLVNSGSSANLVALAALTSEKIKNRVSPGDEVITSAVGFPTTVNPIFQNNLTPVFVDSELGTYNPTAESIINAYTPKTKVIMLAHTLGNPLEIEKIKDFADDKNLFIIANTIISHCEEHKIKCINLAKDGKLNYEDFYDWTHLNPKGSKKASNFISEKLLEFPIN